MSFCEQTRMALQEMLEAAAGECRIKIHGSYRYPVYPNWKASEQNNTDLHLLYVWGGRGCYHMEDGSDIPLERGTLVFISCGVRHRASVDTRDPLRIAGLRFGLYDGGDSDVTTRYAAPVYCHIKPEQQQHYQDITWRIHQLFHVKKDNISLNMGALLIYQLLFDLYELLFASSVEKGSDPGIEQAYQMIGQAAFSKISVPEIAAALGISTRYFQKKFKETFGVTPKEYHMQVKMNTAFSLLKSESHSVAEVSERMGYNDLFAFSRQFKSFFGYPPTYVKRRS